MTLTISLTKIPDAIAAGATVGFMPDTAKNTSEGGVSGRKRIRPVLRSYIISVSPDNSDEVQAIVMAAGTDELLCILDPIAHTLSGDEAEIAADGVTAQIGKRWAPATGSLSVFERVALFVGTPTILVNDLPATSGSFSLGDYGVITFSPPLNPSGDVVKVSGTYLRIVAIVDQSSANAFSPGQYQFNDIRLEECFVTELIRRTS